jgi:limonene-1,2-epoxide hydrolase
MATNNRSLGKDKSVSTRRGFLRGAAIAGLSLSAAPAFARGDEDFDEGQSDSQDRLDERTVLDFWEAWNTKCEDKIMSFFTKDAEYHNIPVAPVVGIDAIRALVGGFLGVFASINIVTVSIAAHSGVVHTERTDNFKVVNGKTVVLPVAGTLYLAKGKIHLWRDYFDLATFEAQSGLKL